MGSSKKNIWLGLLAYAVLVMIITAIYFFG